MAIKRTTYEVAYLDQHGDINETTVEVWACDVLRAEMEGRRAGIRGPVADTSSTGTKVSDLGDHENTEALRVWAALVRTGQYNGASQDFRLRDAVGIEKRTEEPVDPTQQATSTENGSPLPTGSPATTG